MRAFPRYYWPRLAFYGVLLCLAWVLGGLFATAAIEFLVCIGIGATLLIEWGYKTEAFALHRKLSPTGTSAMALVLAAFAAYAFHRAGSTGRTQDLQRALELSMALCQTPLLHLEHNRRVAQAQGRRGA
jgi:hypothetical protein